MGHRRNLGTMKSFTILGLAAALLSLSVMPTAAWGGDGNRSIHRPNRPCWHHCRRNRNNNNDSGGGFWSGGPYSYYPWGPYGPDYRVDYSVNTPSRQSSSPFQIHLNDGIHLSTLDSGYPGPLPAVGEYSQPQYPPPEEMEAPVAPPPAAMMPPVPAPPAPMEAPAAALPATQVDVDLVVGVQRGLRRLGYYRGVINGISDRPTRNAIRAYEANMGLPITGVMSTTLIRSLGVL